MLALSSALSSAQHNISHLLQTHYNHYSEPFTQLDTQEKVMALLPAALRGAARWLVPASATAAIIPGVFILILFTESHATARAIAEQKGHTYYQEMNNSNLLSLVALCWIRAFVFCTIPVVLYSGIFLSFRALAARSICLFVIHAFHAQQRRKEERLLLLISSIGFGTIFSLMLPFSIATCTTATLSIHPAYRAYRTSHLTPLPQQLTPLPQQLTPLPQQTEEDDEGEPA